MDKALNRIFSAMLLISALGLVGISVELLRGESASARLLTTAAATQR
jgi:hypothetical protein